MLRAVDVYTGRLLWQRELKDLGTYYNRTDHFAGAGEIGSNYVTLPDRVYAVYGPKILELDAATGKEVRAFTLKKSAEESSPNWGFIAVQGEYLLATSSPVPVDAKAASKPENGKGIPKDARQVIAQGAQWRYLAGGDPPADWNQVRFVDRSWKTGAAGFGYGDKDDQTTLEMKGNYRRVYIRKTFKGSQVANAPGLSLAINYDDGFIAYLNGQEVARREVSGEKGKKATVGSHEAEGFETIKLGGIPRLLNKGDNLLAIVGYNTSLGSSDFTLDPCLLAPGQGRTPPPKPDQVENKPLPAGQFAPGSRRMHVFNRKTGKKLWERDAVYNWRHNNIALGDDRVFCIDNMTDQRLGALKRRGISLDGDAAVYALDLATGDVLWQNNQQVFGTFLNYSDAHDLVIQAGSSNRDRARDESQVGIAAFRGSDGTLAWQDPDLKYSGPLLLRKDEIITNGNGGFAINLLSGKPGGWSYTRQYGCNSVIGSTHLLTFRSGAAGFYDLLGHSGTSNIGGLRSSCTSNMIAANGVLNLPDYTRTCACAYQNQTSLALVHMPEGEFWTFSGQADTDHIGLNLGAPGDRSDTAGTLWYDMPSTGGKAPSVQMDVRLLPEHPERYRFHLSQVNAGSPRWVASSGLLGIQAVRIKAEAGSNWQLRLHFLEPTSIRAGERVFDVKVNGQTVLPGLDIARDAGGSRVALVKQVRAQANDQSELHLSFKAKTGEPVISGIELKRL